MSVDYEEGRRLLARHAMYRVEASERDLSEWLLDNAEALLNPDPWRGIEEAPKGDVTEDVGCRGTSEWFEGRVAPEYRAGRPEYIIVRRRAWPQDDSWECPGEATYVPGLIDAWRPLRSTHFRELKGPGHV